MTSLITRGTTANSGGSAISTVHTLWITKSCFAVLSHVTFRALTNLLVIAPTTIGTFFITLGVWPCGKNTCNVYIWVYFLLTNPLVSFWRGVLPQGVCLHIQLNVISLKRMCTHVKVLLFSHLFLYNNFKYIYENSIILFNYF